MSPEIEFSGNRIQQVIDVPDVSGVYPTGFEHPSDPQYITLI